MTFEICTSARPRTGMGVSAARQLIEVGKRAAHACGRTRRRRRDQIATHVRRGRRAPRTCQVEYPIAEVVQVRDSLPAADRHIDAVQQLQRRAWYGAVLVKGREQRVELQGRDLKDRLKVAG